MPSDDDLAEKFERVHDHLDLADRTLDDLADDIEALTEDALNNADVDVDYDLDTGRMEADLGLDEVTSRLNQRLDSPFFVTVEERKIVIKDIRSELNFPQGEYTDTKSIKDLIEHLASNHDDGAPGEKVLKLLERAGLSRGDAEREIDKLKQKGEVYEPKHQHLRTT